MLRNSARIALVALMLVGCATAPRAVASPDLTSTSAPSVASLVIHPAEDNASQLRIDSFVARARVVTAAALPADCDRTPIVLDTTSIPTTHITRSEAESRSGGMGDGKPALTAVLGRTTMTNPSADFKGNSIDSRLVWVLGWTGLMHNLPSGGPYRPNGSPRAVQYSTASVLVIDALTGDAIVGIACGLVRA